MGLPVMCCGSPYSSSPPITLYSLYIHVYPSDTTFKQVTKGKRVIKREKPDFRIKVFTSYYWSLYTHSTFVFHEAYKRKLTHDWKMGFNKT